LKKNFEKVDENSEKIALNLEIESEEEKRVKIFSASELITELLRMKPTTLGGDGKIVRTVVGFVGYPNVGKSSTINVLCGETRVRVSATPGKTKHLQTIVLNEELCLCDCPGLVFPTIMSSKAEMICNGILPIDQMRDHLHPVSLLCKRIARDVFESHYGIVLPTPAEHEDPLRIPTAQELLQAYSYIRGFMTSRGNPDESRGARIILKDYVNGALVYVTPPPGADKILFSPPVVNLSTDIKKLKKQTFDPDRVLSKRAQQSYREDDTAFLRQEFISAHVAGRKPKDLKGHKKYGQGREEAYYSVVPVKSTK